MITVDIVDDTRIDSGKVYVTGHGIPGSTHGGQPSSLNVLGPQGKFVQAAVVISAASCNGTTATIITAVAIPAMTSIIFVSGVSVAGYNGVFVITAASGTSISYTVPAALPPATGGVAYLPVLISSRKIQAASGSNGTVTVTLQRPANLPLNSPIFLAGLGGSGAGWNGVQAVAQNPSTNPALGADQFQVAIPGASGSATLSNNAGVDIVSLAPVAVAALPRDSATARPCIVLDQNIATYSAQLVLMVTPSGQSPFPIGVTPGTASLANLADPPFAPGQQAGNSIADIVEFYYAGSGGGSTFDVSQVDGFALPLTLQSSTVSSGPKQVGINAALPGVNRYAIGQAFTSFLQNEPPAVRTVGQFRRLLYIGAVDTNRLAIAPASQTGAPLSGVALTTAGALVTATATGPHGLVPGQAIAVAGAGAPYDGNQVVLNTGLTDSSLNAQQFTYDNNIGPGSPASGSVTPTNSGVIATGAGTLVVEVTSGTAPSPGAMVQLDGVPNGSFSSDINTTYTVQTIPQAAGLPSSAVSLATITGQSFTAGNSSGGGSLSTPVFIAPPSLHAATFYAIAAPKDWLANQPVATANADPMAAWWDATIDAFFKANNYLQVAIGTATSFTGVCDGTQYVFYPELSTSGASAFSIAKPAPSGGQSQSLANATWVWAQAGIPANQQGTVWDQIVQAFCRGVAMAGVLTSPPSTTGQSNTAWTNTATWYATGATYCPFSKFLHYSTLQGTTTPATSSIYTSQLAYGFSEDETPLGTNGAAIATGVPSKMDGTVPDGATLTLTVGPFLPPVTPPVAMAVMEAGVVLEVVMMQPGSGYVVPPIVEITPPGNDGATATAFATIANGQVTKVTMTSGGSRYDFGPQVSFLL